MNFLSRKKFNLVLEITECLGFLDIDIVRIVMKLKFEKLYQPIISNIEHIMYHVYSYDENCFYLVKKMNFNQLKKYESELIEKANIFDREMKKDEDEYVI